MSTKTSVTTPFDATERPVVTSAAQQAESRRRRFFALLARSSGYILLIALAASSIAPLIWLVLTSIRPRNDVFSGLLLPSQFTFEAYQFILTELGIEIYFLNSLRITLITVAAVVVLATMAGYAFARINFWGRHLLFLVLLSTLMVPGPVLIIPLFLQLSELGLIDTQVGLMLAYIGGSLPFSMFLMRSFFETLPAELVDAGRIDGASEFGIFWRIMVPLARPGIATIIIFQFRDTWNEFIFAATIVHTPELRPLQPAIFALVGRYSTNWPALAAGLVVSAVPIVLIYVFMQKQFVSGLTTGAIKG
jgi:ABC-type glycerol-3-phosphate transport system permease component